MLLIGKTSISVGHLYHGYISHNQRVPQCVCCFPWFPWFRSNSLYDMMTFCSITRGEHLWISYILCMFVSPCLYVQYALGVYHIYIYMLCIYHYIYI